ncbi:MAG TPA: hypothetical protein VFQ53_33125 [Kofleriaceae bacterium]|nr:hypothetical protein [Kofleriaceae bacterium]
MSYRDDLEAAHARIEALEAELAAVGGDVQHAQGLIAKSAALEQQIRALAERLRELEDSYQRVAEAMRSARSTLPTLTEYNRSTPPGANATSGNKAGVRCPMCLLLFGDSVEMRAGGNLRMMLWQHGEIGATDQTVRCPRCDFLGLKIG